MSDRRPWPGTPANTGLPSTRDAYDAIAGHMIAGAAADAEDGRTAYWHAEVLSHERRAHDIAVITFRPFEPYRT
ncbi:MAG: hypothetical protein ACRDJ9_21665 [Dehalococcoidia bacterium]